MPSHKHRLKTLRKSEAKSIENTKIKSELKTLAKKIGTAETVEENTATLKQVTSAIDKATKRGVLHKKTAARRISRLTKKTNKA